MEGAVEERRASQQVEAKAPRRKLNQDHSLDSSCERYERRLGQQTTIERLFL